MKVTDIMARPLFIFGCYRSGTTLLRLILNSHPKIAIPEETSFIPIFARKLKEFGDLGLAANTERIIDKILIFLKKKANWSIVPDRGHVLDLLPPYPRYQDIIKAIVLSQEQNPGELVYWGDKTPKYINSVFYLESLFPDARFINVIRDGRDVAASVMSEKGVPWTTVVQVAHEWNTRILYGICARQVIGEEKFITIRYENMVTSPEAEIKRLSDFLGLEYDPSMLNFFGTDAAKIQTKYQRHKNVLKPITNRSVGRYKKVLKEEQIQAFEMVAGPTLLVCGYETEPGNLVGMERMELYLDKLKSLFVESTHHLVSNILKIR